MGFFSKIEGPVKKALNKLFSDPDLTVSISYKEYKGHTKVGSRMVASFTSHSGLTAIRLKHTQKSQLLGSGIDGVGAVEVGDQLYMFRYADVASITHSLKNEIVDENGSIQSIKDIRNIFNLALVITVAGGKV